MGWGYINFSDAGTPKYYILGFFLSLPSDPKIDCAVLFGWLRDPIPLEMGVYNTFVLAPPLSFVLSPFSFVPPAVFFVLRFFFSFVLFFCFFVPSVFLLSPPLFFLLFFFLFFFCPVFFCPGTFVHKNFVP